MDYCFVRAQAVPFLEIIGEWYSVYSRRTSYFTSNTLLYFKAIFFFTHRQGFPSCCSFLVYTRTLFPSHISRHTVARVPFHPFFHCRSLPLSLLVFPPDSRAYGSFSIPGFTQRASGFMDFHLLIDPESSNLTFPHDASSCIYIDIHMHTHTHLLSLVCYLSRAFLSFLARFLCISLSLSLSPIARVRLSRCLCLFSGCFFCPQLSKSKTRLV